MTLDVVLRYRTRRPWAPGPATLRRWAQLAAGGRRGELGIRVVGSGEGRALNERWRGRTHATNVLSFPAAPELGGRQIGDIVVCAPVVAREAREQGKALAAHWAHMVVHGIAASPRIRPRARGRCAPDGGPRTGAARAPRLRGSVRKLRRWRRARVAAGCGG